MKTDKIKILGEIEMEVSMWEEETHFEGINNKLDEFGKNELEVKVNAKILKERKQTKKHNKLLKQKSY